MKVINIHQRIIDQPKSNVVKVLNTLASKDDQIWPYEKWPRMKLDNRFNIGSKGGHGPIKYFVQKYLPGELWQFRFTAPKGFEGVHQLELFEIETSKTEIVHTIEMQVYGSAIISWTFFIRRLHDALIEDAFDKLQNHFDGKNRVTSWSLWVRFWRKILAP